MMMSQVGRGRRLLCVLGCHCGNSQVLQQGIQGQTTLRWFSRAASVSASSSPPSLETVLETYVVVKQGGDDYTKPSQYMLVPPEASADYHTAQDVPSKVGAIIGSRNMMFGARSFHDHLPLVKIGEPLVQAALQDSSSQGVQPQALASLAGLCEWVSACLRGEETSEALAELKAADTKAYGAVEAMATGVPRKGHSVVGVGTYRDGEEGWKTLANEFVLKHPSDEIQMYQQANCEVVGIEHLADTNPEYLQTAGGAMVRLFFI